jgi:hypothetical protein
MKCMFEDQCSVCFRILHGCFLHLAFGYDDLKKLHSKINPIVCLGSEAQLSEAMSFLHSMVVSDFIFNFVLLHLMYETLVCSISVK